MTLHGLSLLAGAQGALGGKTFRAVNPATNTPLEPDFHEAYGAEVTSAMLRFARPVCYQSLPDDLFPLELRHANLLGLMHLVDGRRTHDLA